MLFCVLNFALFQLFYFATTSHFFVRCQNFLNLCKCLMKELIKIDLCILTPKRVIFHKTAQTVDMTIKQTQIY